MVSIYENTVQSDDQGATRRHRKPIHRLMKLLRRVHLYVGLFLLPWVFLYGITGAMYNHYGLFSDAHIATVDAAKLVDTPLANFPSTSQLANQIVDALNRERPDLEIDIDTSQPPEFANDVIVQLFDGELKHAVHIDPVQRSAWVATSPKVVEPLEQLVPSLRNVQLDPDPYLIANQSVPQIMREIGIDIDQSPQPLGWSKLNFLANIDGVPARITYVLRDGHVDITKYEGQDGMSARGFFLRLHTSHGQPPHWNGRMIWSLIVDVMALAMVTWGLTGLVMWWQIKRTRLVGTAVILASLSTAGLLYASMLHFYATTKL